MKLEKNLNHLIIPATKFIAGDEPKERNNKMRIHPNLKPKAMKSFKMLVSLCALFLSYEANAQTATTEQDTVCSGAQNVKYFVAKTVGSTYTWTLTGAGNSFVAPSTDSAIFVNWASTTGTDTLKVVETNSLGCIGDVISLAVTRSSVVIANAGSDLSIGSCVGQNASLSAAASTGSGTLSYAWTSIPAGFTSSSVNPTVSPASTTSYIVTASSSFGCSNTDTVVVTVDNAPVADAGSAVTIGKCAGQSTSLSGAASTGASISYEWSTIALGVVGANSSYLASPSVTTTYTLKVTDTHGCNSTADVVVTVDAAPIANAGNDSTIGACNQSKVLNGTLSSGTNLDFIWTSNPSGFNSTLASVSVITTVTTAYYLQVTDDYGCISKDTVVVTVDAAPIAVAGVDDEICAGSSKQLNASASSGAAPLSYSWTPIATLNFATIVNPVATPAATTTYTVTVTDTHNCTATDDVKVSVLPKPSTSSIFHY